MTYSLGQAWLCAASSRSPRGAGVCRRIHPGDGRPGRSRPRGGGSRPADGCPTRSAVVVLRAGAAGPLGVAAGERRVAARDGGVAAAAQRARRGAASRPRGGLRADLGDARAQSHCRFAPPFLHFIPDLRRDAVHLGIFLKRHRDRTLGADGGRWRGRALAGGAVPAARAEGDDDAFSTADGLYGTALLR